MATSPSNVRAAVTLVTAAAIADLQAVAEAGGTAEELRSNLFYAAPLIVADYADGTAALALDWYDEIRADAKPDTAFEPTPIRRVTDADVRAMVAETTVALRTATTEDLAEATETSLRLLEGGLQKKVMTGFWDTMTVNATRDPNAGGWRRYTRPNACKFCQMIAGRGAVFSRNTATFAAHDSCHCLAAPSFDPNAPKASAVQYLAINPDRGPEQRAELRAYLNENFPNARG